MRIFILFVLLFFTSPLLRGVEEMGDLPPLPGEEEEHLRRPFVVQPGGYNHQEGKPLPMAEQSGHDGNAPEWCTLTSQLEPHHNPKGRKVAPKRVREEREDKGRQGTPEVGR